MSLSKQEQRIRWGVLGSTTTPIVGAFLYNQGYRVSLLDCPIRHLTGLPCPTCGMTRSFIAIGRGDFNEAVAYHLFGPVLFLVFLITGVHVALELLYRRRVSAFYLLLLANRKVQLYSLLSLLLYHAVRLYWLADTGELLAAIMRSPFGHLF